MKKSCEYLPGARIFKSIFAITVSLLFSRYLLHTSGFYMTVGVFLSMKQSFEKTKIYGKDRIFGTIIGGILGFVVMHIFTYFQIEEFSNLTIVINVLAIFCLLWIVKVFKLSEPEATMGSVVFLSITLIRFQQPILGYVISRVVETAMGVILAMVVNSVYFHKIYRKYYLLFKRKSFQKQEDEDCDLRD